jgi:hypothetical protein
LLENADMNELSRKKFSSHFKTNDYLPHAWLYPSTDLAPFCGRLFWFFRVFTVIHTEETSGESQVVPYEFYR